MNGAPTVGVTVNGEERWFAQAPTMAELLSGLGLPDRGVAVAVDGALFPGDGGPSASRRAGRSRC